MEAVSSTLHRCLKDLHNRTIHCIIGDPNPFNHYNLAFSPKSPQMQFGHIFPIIVLINDHPHLVLSHSSPLGVDLFIHHEGKSPEDSTEPSSNH